MIYTESDAERMKKHAGEPYRPSNGTEGDIFQSAYCQRCKHDNFDNDTCEGGCEILLRSMAFKTDDPNYPREWIIATDGQPTCTAFEQRVEGD